MFERKFLFCMQKCATNPNTFIHVPIIFGVPTSCRSNCVLPRAYRFQRLPVLVRSTFQKDYISAGMTVMTATTLTRDDNMGPAHTSQNPMRYFCLRTGQKFTGSDPFITHLKLVLLHSWCEGNWSYLYHPDVYYFLIKSHTKVFYSSYTLKSPKLECGYTDYQPSCNLATANHSWALTHSCLGDIADTIWPNVLLICTPRAETDPKEAT